MERTVGLGLHKYGPLDDYNREDVESDFKAIDQAFGRWSSGARWDSMIADGAANVYSEGAGGVNTTLVRIFQYGGRLTYQMTGLTNATVNQSPRGGGYLITVGRLKPEFRPSHTVKLYGRNAPHMTGYISRNGWIYLKATATRWDNFAAGTSLNVVSAPYHIDTVNQETIGIRMPLENEPFDNVAMNDMYTTVDTYANNMRTKTKSLDKEVSLTSILTRNPAIVASFSGRLRAMGTMAFMEVSLKTAVPLIVTRSGGIKLTAAGAPEVHLLFDVTGNYNLMGGLPALGAELVAWENSETWYASVHDWAPTRQIKLGGVAPREAAEYTAGAGITIKLRGWLNLV